MMDCGDRAEALSYSSFQIGARQSFNRNRSPWLAATNDLLRHADADLEHAWTIYATQGWAPSQLVTCTTPDGDIARYGVFELRRLPIIERTYDHHYQSLCLVYADSSAPLGGISRPVRPSPRICLRPFLWMAHDYRRPYPGDFGLGFAAEPVTEDLVPEDHV